MNAERAFKAVMKGK